VAVQQAVTRRGRTAGASCQLAETPLRRPATRSPAA
jgi:hypothetical protein